MFSDFFTAYCQVDSHKKAAAATAAGRFKDEIIPVATKVLFNSTAVLADNVCMHLCNGICGLYCNTDFTEFKQIVDPKSGDEKPVTISVDDGIRNTTLSDLAKLKPVFKKDGSTTAGILLTEHA